MLCTSRFIQETDAVHRSIVCLLQKRNPEHVQISSLSPTAVLILYSKGVLSYKKMFSFNGDAIHNVHQLSAFYRVTISTCINPRVCTTGKKADGDAQYECIFLFLLRHRDHNMWVCLYLRKHIDCTRGPPKPSVAESAGTSTLF